MTTAASKLPGEVTSVFRGTWQPQIYKPVFGAYQFLPTPVAQEPRRRTVQKKEEEEEEKPREEAPEPKPARELMSGPPEGVLVAFKVLDREKNYRSCIAQDGTCYNNLGDVIGFLNCDTFEAGSVSEEFLGNAVESQFNNLVQIRDSEEELVGYLDMGTRSIKLPNLSTVADFEQGGVLKHPNGTFLGQFEGARGFHNMKELTLYLVLLDPGMCSDVSG